MGVGNSLSRLGFLEGEELGGSEALGVDGLWC